jgi:hypothetical protein
MISWLVIGILIIVAILAIKIDHIKHRFFIIMLVLLALFLYTSMAMVSKDNSIDLSTSEGFFSATKVYFGWLANGFDNLKALTGKAIKMDWTSSNKTFFDDSEDKDKTSKRTRR